MQVSHLQKRVEQALRAVREVAVEAAQEVQEAAQAAEAQEAAAEEEVDQVVVQEAVTAPARLP